MQRAHGLPDERLPRDDWKEGANHTRYMRVTLTGDSGPVEKANDSLYLSSTGHVTRGVRIEGDERLIEPLDYNKLR
jgi:hypothetical protein